MNSRDDRFDLVDNSQSSSYAMFWRTKLGVLIVVTGICAVVLVTSSGLILGGVTKLRYIIIIDEFNDAVSRAEIWLRN